MSSAEAPFLQQFLLAAKERGFSDEYCYHLADLLPASIFSAPCFKDRLTKLWRYEFGAPINRLPNGMEVYGSHMYHLIDQLVEGMVCADRYLSPSQLDEYGKRLGEPLKHSDVLTEMLPVLRLSPHVNAEFEVEGYGMGNRKIDWLIRPPEEVPILLDVKQRKRDMVEYFGQLTARDKTTQIAPEPKHDASLLFLSLESKFLSRAPTEFLQGAWIHSGFKQEQTEFEASFSKLDGTRIHFAILGGWDEEAFVIARQGIDSQNLIRILGRTYSDRFIFRRGESFG